MKEKTRLTIAVAGIAFADMLIFLQLAFQDALYDSTTMPHRLLEADLVMVNPKLQTLFSVKNFPRERLYQALGHKGVESVSSVYLNMGRWKNPETRFEHDLLVWGIEPEGLNFQLPEIKTNINSLKQLNTVLFDSGSRPEYGPIGDLLRWCIFIPPQRGISKLLFQPLVLPMIVKQPSLHPMIKPSKYGISTLVEKSTL